MSIQCIYRYIYILIINIALLSGSQDALAQATADTTASSSDSGDSVKVKEKTGHQFNIGFDITRPVMNALVANKQGYELEADYYLRKEIYIVAEGGWGSSNVNYLNSLEYKTNNSFFRLGVNKSILARVTSNDWDMFFIGVRYGMAFINRGQANYTVTDSLWGTQTGQKDSKSFDAYWAEVTGGMRVELLKGLMAGWNVRGKFLLSTSAFKDLAPLYVAGFGRGDKNTIFDFNVYLSYAIRWNRKK